MHGVVSTMKDYPGLDQRHFPQMRSPFASPRWEWEAVDVRKHSQDLQVQEWKTVKNNKLRIPLFQPVKS
jgi:hypothetical protein